MQLTPGSRLGPYEVLASLGAGGMGEVYRARDTKLGREVAIKALPEEFARDRKHVARFEREAKLLASLNHPNIGGIHGLVESGDRSYLILELVEGRTLAQRLHRGAMPLADAIRVCRQIATGLEVAHESGIVHRDLKPGNVMLTRTEEVKILDFGLAKDVEAAAGNDPALTPGASGPTSEGVVLGTAPYMSPEQAGGRPVDRRTDIWAFGCVLYECLTGRVLFLGANHLETIARVQFADPDYDALPAATPARVKELLRRCLTRDPKLRLRDIGEARIALEGTQAGDVAAAPIGRTRPNRRRDIAWITAGVCAIVAVGLGVLLWRQRAAVPSPPRFERLTFAPQFISNARFAADGRTVVFSAAREGNTSELFIRHPEDPQPRSLGGRDIQLLSVSSKGELAVLTRTRYLYHRTYLGTLARMPLAEASPREIMDGVTAADWSPDGEELAVVRQVAGKSRLEYPIGSLLAESSGYLSDVRVSPGNDRIAFMPHVYAGDDRGRVVIIDRSGAEVAKSAEYWGVEGLAWSADGASILFSASENGSSFSVRALAADGSVVDALTDPTGLMIHDMTADGRLLVATHMQRESLVVRSPDSPGERDLPWLGASTHPRLSRDGRRLLFTDQSQLAGPNYAVYLRATDGSPPVRLGEGIGADISPDGASVLVIVMSDPPRLMIYPTGAGEPRDISARGVVSYDWISARFFLEGRGVSFCASEAGKASSCYVQLDGGLSRAVTPEGTGSGFVSPDGRVAVARGTDGSYWMYPLDGSEPVRMSWLDDRDRILSWREDARSVLVYHADAVPTRVERLDLETGERSLVRELAPVDRAGALQFYGASFSADENAYAYSLHRVVNALFVVAGVRTRDVH